VSIAVDVSNYTDAPLRAGDVQCWMANGVDRVIVQAVQGGGKYPPGQTPQQLQACTQAGVRTDGYVLPFAGDSVQNLRAKHALTTGYRIGQWWGDFEEPMGVDYIRFVLTEMDKWAADSKPAGIYTAQWFIDSQHLNMTEFANRPLWIMDNQRKAGSPNIPAPWTTYAMHQYALDTWLCSIKSIDLSYVNPDWANGGPTTPVSIIVGEGLKNQMTAAGDHPFFGHVWGNFTDEEGIAHGTEECYGTKGRYMAVETAGAWETAGPF
jgi:hypothetical protein